MVGFPLLLVPLALYNAIVLLIGVSSTDVLFNVPMMAGRQWPVTSGDILLALGIVLLLLEIIKCAQPGGRRLMDHLLSLIVFGAAAAEFVMLPKFGTSPFFLLTLLAMTDFFGGIAHRRRRRFVLTEEVPFSPDPAPSKTKPQVEEPVVEPRLDAPAPQPSSASQAVPEVPVSPNPAPSKARPQVEEPVEPRLDPAPTPLASASQAAPVFAPLKAAQSSAAESLLVDQLATGLAQRLVDSSADDPAPDLQPSATDPTSPEAPSR